LRLFIIAFLFIVVFIFCPNFAGGYNVESLGLQTPKLRGVIIMSRRRFDVIRHEREKHFQWKGSEVLPCNPLAALR
jgi:hypothetical protein